MKPAGQMTLTLTSELEQFVRAEVKRGAFASSSEYVRDLVRERYMIERDRLVQQALQIDPVPAKSLTTTSSS